jgi:hypothetical protein
MVENIQATDRLDNAEYQLNVLYNTSKKNVLFIRDLIELDLRSEVPLEVTIKKLNRFLKIDENYFQARFIDPKGMELIRVEEGKPIHSGSFQYKGDRYYFREAITLKQGDIFISDLDMNVENGEIEIPYRPTIRFFTPVFYDMELMGVVGLNLNARTWLNHFENQDINLLNSSNQVIYGSQEELYSISKIDFDQMAPLGNPYFVSKRIGLEG